MQNLYESDRAVAEYLLFHYGSAEEILPYPSGPVSALGFAVRTVSELLDPHPLPAEARALDIGCAVGRSAFELSRRCAEVVGIDYSHAFVQAAELIRTHGNRPYERVDEGELTTALVARLPAQASPARVRFEQGDAMALRADLGVFDVVHAANLIDRLPEPIRFLERAPSLVKPGGLLLLTSPYTWLESFTPRTHWLGGLVRNGHPLRTLEALRRTLEPHFRLQERRDLPFLIREHARKFQWSVAEGTVWTRNA